VHSSLTVPTATPRLLILSAWPDAATRDPYSLQKDNTKIQQTAHAAAVTKNAITRLPRNHKKTPGARIPQKKKQEPEATAAEARVQYINRKKAKVPFPSLEFTKDGEKKTNKQTSKQREEK
jgi:hypothetical protein